MSIYYQYVTHAGVMQGGAQSPEVLGMVSAEHHSLVRSRPTSVLAMECNGV